MAVAGKGNVVSFDGKDWSLLTDYANPGELENNFVLMVTVSSESAIEMNNLHETKMYRQNSELVTCAQTALPVYLRGSLPAAFPEVTKYQIYRNNSYHKIAFPPSTSFEENNSLSYSTYYQISAIYDDDDRNESERSERVYISTVENEHIDAAIRIFPTFFTNALTLQGHEFVSRIEVVTVTGKVCMIINTPHPAIDTSTLPSGIYFFRIYDVYHRQRVIKAVKGN
jgi:hypothetical protein